MKKEDIIFGFAIAVFLAAGVQLASAHVIVRPNIVGVGTDDVPFTVAVPTEKDIPTTGLRLMLPPGLGDVTPDATEGWKVNVVMSGDAATEIDWTGGAIPVGERMEFGFSAQAPAVAGTLAWKAYQTYQDGSVVAWDQDPSDLTAANPYSETKVVDDLAATPPSWFATNGPALILSIAALALSLFAVAKRAGR